MAEDEAFECVAIRATLDAFWSRTTVKRHVREVEFTIKYGRAFCFNPFPPLGPYPLYQHMGMLQAILVEMRSMEKRARGEGRMVMSVSNMAQQIWHS
jgi:hypothetical protein